MAKDQQRLQILWRQYIKKAIAEKELNELLDYFREDTWQQDIYALMDSHAGLADTTQNPENIDWERMYAAIVSPPQVRMKRLWWPRVAAAASIVLCMSVAAYLIWHKKPVLQAAQNKEYDIRPGSNRAVLTARGRTVILDKVKNGRIIDGAGVSVSKTADGRIAYLAPPGVTVKKTNNETVYDTLTTPRGGQHELTLSDGTNIWLNAATQLRFPESFNGDRRTVELIYGEAYFEVKHNAAQPFRVVVKGEVIDDVGTSFNVSAYDDEAELRTTLLSGSVSVEESGNRASLTPGKQAVFSVPARSFTVNKADVERTIAWHQGNFVFNRTGLYQVMKDLSRWYDVDIVYQGTVKDDVCFGKIKRSANLSKILKVLELGDIHFRIEGRKLIVLP